MPSRLLSVGPRTVFGGMGRWTRVAPGQLPWHAAPRLLSASCADLSKHQEPPGKKPLSEKKLIQKAHSTWLPGPREDRGGSNEWARCALCRRGILWTIAECSSEGDVEATG